MARVQTSQEQPRLVLSTTSNSDEVTLPVSANKLVEIGRVKSSEVILHTFVD